MPGRFSLGKDIKSLRTSFPWLHVPDGFGPRYNISPTQGVAVATNDAPKQLDFLTWGLIPSWSKGVKMTKFLINARAESVATRPSFKSSFRRRRCLVFADGYYEWVKEKGKREKIPFYVQLISKDIFAFAGLWDSWQSIDGSEIKSCCIITTEPNELVSKIHHRMGAILEKEDFDIWLQPGEANPEELQALLKPYTAEKMNYHQVSTFVTKKENDSEICISPI